MWLEQETAVVRFSSGLALLEWCACSAWVVCCRCDGAHKSTNMKPVVFEAETDTLWMCGACGGGSSVVCSINITRMLRMDCVGRLQAHKDCAVL